MRWQVLPWAPAGAVAGGDDVEIEAVQRLDGLRDNPLVDAAEMQAAQDRMQLDAGKARARMRQHIDHAGMAAGREDDQALAPHVHGDEALVHQELVGLPALAVFGAAMLAGQARLEAAGARDFAADEHRVARDRLHLARGDDAAAICLQGGNRRHILHRSERTVRQFGGAAAEHVGMHVARDVAPAVAVAHKLQRAQHGAGMIPVAVSILPA